MKILYTEREKLRYLNIAALVLFLGSIIIEIYGLDDYSVLWQDIVLLFEIFAITEIILLCIWYPEEYRKKEAMRNGEIYYGKITDIQLKKRTHIGLSRQSYIYTMTVECDCGGEKKRWERGNYTDNPRDYVPKDYKVKVYAYKGRCYLPDFYKQGSKTKRKGKEKQEDIDSLTLEILSGKFNNKPMSSFLKYSISEIPYLSDEEEREAGSERLTYSSVRSKTYLIVSPQIVMYQNRPPCKWVYVEVHMKSKKAYDEYDFSLGKKLYDYLRAAEQKYSLEEEPVLYDEISELVREAIMSKDKRVMIEEVCVVVR